MNLRVVSKLSSLPGPRFKNQGEGSGEAFREDYLVPAFQEALSNGEKLYVNMDGATYGYPTSFLEEAFGGLVRQFEKDKVKKALVIECVTEPLLVQEIEHYMEYAQENRTPPFPCADNRIAVK